jgi:putative membrane protein
MATGQTSRAGDRAFVRSASQGGMAEVELGKLAVATSANPGVKQFGQLMVDDHGKANDALKALALSKHITLPVGIDAKDRLLRRRLSKLSGAAFDGAYMQAMLADHRKDVAEFQRVSSDGVDADIKAFASRTLPTLENHLKLAQETTANVAVGTSGRSTEKNNAAVAHDTVRDEKGNQKSKTTERPDRGDAP